MTISISKRNAYLQKDTLLLRGLSGYIRCPGQIHRAFRLSLIFLLCNLPFQLPIFEPARCRSPAHQMKIGSVWLNYKSGQPFRSTCTALLYSSLLSHNPEVLGFFGWAGGRIENVQQRVYFVCFAETFALFVVKNEYKTAKNPKKIQRKERKGKSTSIFR